MEIQTIVIVTSISLGFISLCKTLLKFFNWVWKMFFRPAKNLKEYGSWVLITGSTDGIGKALAFELALKGLNIVLVGRNPIKLEKTMHEIHESIDERVDIKAIVIDFEKLNGDEICRKIEKGVEGLDVGIVINNVGLANPYAKYFHEIKFKFIESIIKVNIHAAIWVTKAIIPSMVKKKKGAIVNIGSASCFASYPFYVIYAASKACLAMFSKCIWAEYKHHNIDVQCQVPFFVATKMSKLRRSNLLVASPAMYSKASVRFIGYEQLCSPFWSHSIQWWIIQALPDSLLTWCLFRYFLGMRERGLLKDSVKANSPVPNLKNI